MKPLLWGLSAAGTGSLRSYAGVLLDDLRARADWSPADIGLSLAAEQAHGRRAAVSAVDREGFLVALEALAEGRGAAGLTEGAPTSGDVVFVFPGQGSQWPGMAVELLEFPVFRERMLECARALEPFVDWDLFEALDDAEALRRTDVVQPVLFAVMVSLAALWRSYGVEPSGVLGHSLGEVVAAVVADALSIEDGARVVALWSQAQATLAGDGAMIAVPAAAEDVADRLAAFDGRLVLGAINGPRSVIVSGDADAALELLDQLVGEGISARRIDVDLAAHSPHIDRITEWLREALAPIRPRRPSVPFLSSARGEVLPKDVALDAGYWCHNLRNTIQFERATRLAVDNGAGVLLEISPHPVLTAAIQQTVEDAGALASVRGSLRRGQAGPSRVMAALGQLHVDRVPVDWDVVYAGHSPRVVPLPSPERANTHAESPLRGRLAGMNEAEQRELLTSLVRQEIQALRGTADAVSPDRQFRELGFDSVTSLEIRARISSAVGVDLPVTMVFDHPTPADVAEFVRVTLAGAAPVEDVALPGRPADDDPVVIVGIGCRYPGGVSGPDDLWRLVSDGADVVSDFPGDRGWDFAAAYDDQSRPPGTFYQRQAGFLGGAAEFDAEFFGISPREAAAMDPQQRLLLETAWEALEHAGIVPASLRGSGTGVFVGAMTMDYGPRMDQGSEAEGYVFTGNTGSVMSGRVSYLYGFEGPAVTVDTACSSSLVALHLAAQSLRRGECGLALAAGVTVMSGSGMFVEFSRQGGLAPDGRSKAFSDSADGFGLAEGVGVLVLERLSDARRNGHTVLAVIRGSAINQDGASNGMTAPSGPSQQRVIRAALADAGLSTSDVDAVEAHGTGTRLGDPIEAQALIATYGQDRVTPVYLGSLKSNIGHTQAAAGVGGVIKMVQAMRHGVLPKTLHVTAPTTHVDWSAGAVELLTEQVPWPATDVRRAGVSSFGVSGTNAHVVVEQAPEPVVVEQAHPALVPLPLSGRGQSALREQAARLVPLLRTDVPLADIAWSTALTRTAFDDRAVVLGADREELLAGLAALGAGMPATGVVRGIADTRGVAFVFPGQGSQWAGMAVDLMESSPVFAAQMDRCADVFESLVGWDLFEALIDPDALQQVDVVQPVLFAVMVSLAALWRAHGVEPSVVVGHSQGEIAAAYVAGALSLEDAARVVALRSKAIRASLAGRGGMVSIPVPAADLDLDERVSIAAVNGPSSTVVAGDPEALDELLARWDRAKRIPVDYASHTAQVEELREELLALLDGIEPRATSVPFHSTVTNTVVPGTELNAEYWYENLRQTVRFDDAVRALAGHLFVECSPHPVLTAAVNATTVGSLRREDGGFTRFLTSLAEAYAHGAPVDWSTLLRGNPVPLPTYAFQRERFWLDGSAPSPTDAADLGLVAPEHPLLGAATALPESGGFLFTSRISLSSHPWLADHAVRGAVLLPGTGFVELAVRAGDQVGCDLIEELVLEAPLEIPADGTGVRLQVAVAAADETGRRRITVHSLSHEDWTLHAAGVLCVGAGDGRALTQWPPAAEEIDLADAYETLGNNGLDYGSTFRGLTRAWRRADEIFAEAALPEGVEHDGFGLHPVLLDAGLHALVLDGAELPFSWHDVALHSTGATATRVRLTRSSAGVSVVVADTAGNPVLTARSLVMRPVPERLHGRRRAEGFAVRPVRFNLPTDAPTTDAVVLLPNTADEALAAVQSGADLVVVTRNAATDPAQAAVRGLMRSAISEHPGRFVLVDTDDVDAVEAQLARIVASGEPELWLHEGVVSVPRLTVAETPEDRPEWTPQDCVLITGGTGTIGRAIAEHLLRAHGVGRVVLASRSGLTDLDGAEAVACDVTDRDALAALFEQYPITAVVHAAAVLDDGVIESLTPERMAAVHAPKAGAAWHLHELTRDRELTAFILFSSIAGVFGTAGQGNYAAANCAVDAIAEVRRAEGLPATSIAWGLWAESSTLTGALSDVDRARLGRFGVAGMSTEDALTLFDASTRANTVAVRLDRAALRARTDLPAVLRGFTGTPARRKAEVSGDSVLTMVRDQVADVLGHRSGSTVGPDTAFQGMGFDSLTAVEFRNRMNALFAVRLPATLVFDHPTPRAVADFVLAELTGRSGRLAAAPVAARVDEPIAIVGMSCRYPGGVESPDDLWRLVVSGTDAISRFPEDRGWDLEALFDLDPERSGRSYVRQGGFLHDATGFDAEFFGISPREALAMDPQQRLLLETAWEAFERAGIAPDSLRGSQTGVFAGVMNGGYGAQQLATSNGAGETEGYLASGTAASVASGRISYTFGLEGPALTVDTACSSSLVALHLAVQALRRGECSMALAGGVTVMASPALFVEFSRQRGLSPDGRSKSFAAGADGTSWSEGAGMLVLERLSDARRNGRRVLAVVRGTAVNQDGASNGLTSPNGPSQQRVIRAALADAGLSTVDVDAVEAHGTGTRLGDPIEAQALLATYGQDRSTPVYLGSLKSNIGHSQAAAGVGGVIKMVEAMRHGLLPRTLHVDEPTPEVDWSTGAVSLLTEPTAWPEAGRPRRAGVSSFGVSGTNAHVIVEQAEPEAPPATRPAPSVLPWVLSAGSAVALSAQIERLREFAAGNPEVSTEDIGYSLATTRARLAHRAVVLGDDVVVGDGGTERRVTFVFPGQGSQWVGMAVELLESPVFASRMAECAAALREFADWDLFEVLLDAEALERVDVVQPALFAVMVSLASLWRSYGVEPAAVVGHSQGEIAAACVVGALSLEDAARVVVLRSKAIAASLAGRGGMVSVALPAADVELDSRLSIAAVNGPSSTVVSGEPDALREFAERTQARVIPVDYASHSAQVEALHDELMDLLAPISPRSSEIPFYSAVTGEPVDTSGLDAAYWFRNLRETVRFDLATERLLADGITAFIESSGHPVLAPAILGTTEQSGHDAIIVGSLRREDGGLRRMLTSVAEAYTQGVAVDWTPAFGAEARVVDLPTYAFQRKHFWLGAEATPVDSWRYRVEWRGVPDRPAVLSGTWAVVTAGEPAELIVEALTTAGATPVVVGPDAVPSEGIAGIVSLVALTADDPLAATLELIQKDIDAPLWTVTRGVETEPEQAAVWGLGRVAALERPKQWGGLIDLPASADEQVHRRLVAVLGGTEDQVALRAEGILGRRLVRAPRPRARNTWQPTGTVLITGGTGAIGAHIARHFARNGAEHLVLTGRRGPEAPGAGELEAELTALGARVTIAACDVADRDALAAVVASIEPVRTVVHAAGVAHWGDLADITADDFAELIAGKARGAEHLDQLFDHDLDAFVLISSNAGVWGGSGQGAYAAGNAMLDALAARRRARGLRAVSLAWGSWAGEGMAAGDTGARFERLGLNLMRPSGAVAALMQAIADDETFLAVADVDWAKFAPTFTINRPSPLLSELPEAQPAQPEETTGLAAVPVAVRRRVVRELVSSAVAAVLGHESEAVAGRTFKELGFDSMTAVDMRTKLSAATGLKLPSTLVFDHPTAEALVTHLLDRLYGRTAAVVTASAAPVSDDPIAIVGMSCRYPGGVASPDDLWRLVERGVDAITEFPADRGWDIGALYHPDPANPGTTYTRHGGFLDGAADFDAGFFRISPREALAMDPQQRVVLETAWEAFERAGIDPTSLRGTGTGVFVGASAQEYGPRLHEAPAGLEGHFLTGGLDAVISGRVAYELGLEGPAMTVDTACSSSLVALHLAVQALRRGECSMALTGGVAVLSSPGVFLEFSRQRGLSADGRCRSFSASASGTGWAEGAGMLVLERLSDARRNGHPVLAVVRGSAVNQDGASNGLTAPNGPSQQRVIRAALADAGLSTSDVAAVEAHGTGTTLGDPIEAQALLATYGQNRSTPVYLGTLKSNIGHSQAASGVGGIIKMVQAMRHGVLPKTLHVDEPSPHVDWSAGAVQLLTEPVEWSGPRRAGVSAFGVSGTNAHVIIEHVPAVETSASETPALVPVPLSARGEEALRAQAVRLRGTVGDLAALARSQGTGRAGLPDRAVVLATSRDDLLDQLDVLARGETSAKIVRGTATASRFAALFSGQGSQRSRMGLTLTFPEFQDAFAEVVAELDKHLDRSLLDVISDDAEALERTEYTQPALFAVEVALFRLLEAWGLRPDFLVGHSVGELAAAHVAGVLSLADASRLVVARGRLMQALPPGGAMISIRSTVDEIVPLLVDGVSIAAVNGPESVVISGDEDAVEAIAGRFEKTRRIRTSHAFHSARMDAMLAGFRAVAESVSYAPPTIPIVSTVTGAPVEPCSADYWVRQVREPVLFHDAVQWLLADGVTAFVELGPDSVLSATVDAPVVVPMMRRDRPELDTAVAALAALHVNGVSPDWAAVFPGAPLVEVPTYPFQRRRYWFGDADQGLIQSVTRHADGVLLTGKVSAATRQWVADHRVLGTTLLPGTAFVELALRAADEVGHTVVDEIALEAPLVFDGSETVEIQVSVQDMKFAVHSRRGSEWTRHATGVLGTGTVIAQPVQWPPTGTERDLDEIANALVERGYDYGAAYSGLVAAWSDGAEWFAEVELPEGFASDGLLVHPALLDTALQPLVLTLTGGAELPFAWRRVALHGKASTSLRARLRKSGEGFSVRVDDASGQPVLSAESVVMRAVPGGRSVSLLTVQHVPVELSEVDGSVQVVAPVSVDDALAAVQQALTGDSRVVVMVQDAQIDPVQAAIAGLVRSAQSEHPGRFLLVDTDDLSAVRAVDEPEIVVRSGQVTVPRLQPVPVGVAPVWSQDDCVLITGGTGTLAHLVAKHLVAEHGVRRLVLIARSEVDPDFVASLDADVTAVRCDVTDRAAVAAVLAEHPITAVVHTAGVLDDGVIESLTPARMAGVAAPKVLGAQHLDELTRDRELTAFVLFSSAAGVIGTAGQGNYAAANSALDAIARARHAVGLPATSVAWGMWAEAGGMAEGLSAADRARLARSGLASLSTVDALAMFDAAVAGPEPVYVASRQLPKNTVRPARKPVAADDLPSAVLRSVRAAVAEVLGHSDARSIDVGRPFQELGFDSLTSVELRNRVNAEFGLALPATLVFDHPNATSLADRLVTELSGAAPAAAPVAAASTDDDPIVIVGMACRYPGGVRSPEDLWRLVAEGGQGITPFPTDRGWDLGTLFDDDRERHGHSYARAGGFLHEAVEFDPAFFGISPREAIAMDPQQRLLLETSWEALEHAGIDPETLRGSQTGVFAGVMAGDYATRVRQVPEDVEGYLGNGSTGSITSGRVSYTLGLEGPALTVDTACSASLVAIHLAAQSLRRGECSLALAGGVTVLSTPVFFVEYSRQGALSPDSRCKSFSADADGTAGGEGVGMVLLERLSDARRNGHTVLALVRGSAINQDGASNGLTAPNGPSQQRVIRAALADAGLSTSDVDVVEAHGTGTRLGDPIEAQAVIATYGQDRSTPVYLGSLKSNIGHTQAAAGVGGVIKMVQAMRHGILPKTLNVTEPTPRVDWSAGAVELLTEQMPWPEVGRRRRAGVSGFGVSGTNAHVVLEQAPTPVPARESSWLGPVPMAVSARDEVSLAAQARRFAEHLRSEVSIVDVAWSALTTRNQMRHRAVVLASARDSLVAGLSALAEDAPSAEVVRGEVVDGGAAFVFPGQGSQWVGMAVELLESPVFSARMAECAAALREFADWDLFEVLSDAEALQRVDVVQPVLFAVMVSLAALWRSYGVEPAVVIGHSQGEIAAACVAGALSLRDAARVVVLRSKAIRSSLAGRGGMVSVPVPVSEISGDVSIAAVNGPSLTVVAGDPAALDGVLARWDRAKRIPVDYASHSAQVEEIRDELLDALASIAPQETSTPFFSTVTCEYLPGSALNAEYWYENLRQTVRFNDAVNALDGHVFIECSPHPVLMPALDVPALGSLRRDEGGTDRFLKSLAEAHVRGIAVDWGQVFAGRGQRVSLPTYAFHRDRYWLEAGTGTDVSSAGLDASGHAMLGAAVPLAASGGFVFTARLSTHTHPWLADHAVQGTVLVPGAVFVDWVVRAGEETGCPRVDELMILEPLALTGSDSVQVQVTVEPREDSGNRRFSVHARIDSTHDWTLHATGVLAPQGQEHADDLVDWPPPGGEPLAVDGFYDLVRDAGLEYGSAFQGVRAAWRRGEEVYAEIRSRADLATSGFGVHPALLDAAVHSAVLGVDLDQPKLPFAWNGVTLWERGGSALRVRISPRGDDTVAVLVADEAGRPVLSVDSVLSRAAGGEQLHRVRWVELPVPSGAPVPTALIRDLAELDASVPEIVFVQVEASTAAGLPAAAREVTNRVLGLVQGWLADERFAESKLVFVRSGQDLEDLPGAAAWGLLRSAQSEHPGRFQLIDVDKPDDHLALLQQVSALDEPQVVLRDGVALVPRIGRAQSTVDGPLFGPDDTVLITGGTGVLGRLVARHLVTSHGVRKLVLVSRRGPAAAGALVAELEGAEVAVVAADMSDRNAVAALLRSHPVTAVVHSAGALDDGLVQSLSPERIDAVFKSKVDAAVHLHELATDAKAFVLFSSAAGTIGTAGQGNYAAANAFLDALAAHRHASGLPATSIAWGLWEDSSDLTAGLSDRDRERLEAVGGRALSGERGLALFDAAVAQSEPVVVAMPLDLGAVRAGAGSEPLRALARTTVQQTEATAQRETLAQRILRLPEERRLPAMVAAVVAETGAVLGHRSSAGVQDFKQLGFDSLTAVELRNRLAALTGLRLPASLVFDYPNAQALGEFLLGEIAPAGPDDADVRAVLASIPLEDLRDNGLLDQLLRLARRPAPAEERSDEQIDSMDAEDLIAMALGGES
ncbi:Acyl transferase domain-containing protein [Allokutzneria albata]|uniref:Acyl transferase domain-containing protein n=1 Tax=Allokutzneria albata TaxID=211114 RepID=A0A1G9SNC4_ALLAB|nr:Acyl transferase domain-containing protein [Allokutzneria albata]